VNLTYSSVVVTNGLTHIYSGISGTQIQGEIILLNNSDEEQTVNFSLNDAIFSCTENRTFSTTQSHIKSSLKWFEGSLMDKVLNPREQYTYKFVINIPQDQALRGTFWSMLMVDIAKPIKREKLTQNIGLNTKMRYAIALITNVNSLDDVSLDFQKVDIDKTTGNKNLTIKIANQHLFIEGVKLSLEVYDDEGKNVFEKTTIRGLVFPGFCKDYIIDITELPKGNYTCLLVADSREKFVGTNVSLTID
jgi:hypothetical protein